MDMAVKTEALREIYKVYDTVSQDFPAACKRGCATCCTQNVTMTTLEGYRIRQSLNAKGHAHLLQATCETTQEARFRPVVSTNALAALCLRGEEPPDEGTSFSPRPCPLLLDNECPIYEDRPFGCRCFSSTQVCTAAGFAVTDPLLVTINTVFLQFIEHVDTGGFFGNLTDILLFLEFGTHYSPYEAATTYSQPALPRGLTPNTVMPALLVPPEHQQPLQPILSTLRRIEEKLVFL
jgi:Fe-S-cluster containining protein